MNPMPPIHSMASRANSTNRLLSGAQSSVAMTVENRMITPPMVGVPRFPWWVVGPSTRITCPIFFARSRPMIAGPIRNASRMAVTVAAAARKLM